jgi:hypothetical protein
MLHIKNKYIQLHLRAIALVNCPGSRNTFMYGITHKNMVCSCLADLLLSLLHASLKGSLGSIVLKNSRR